MSARRSALSDVARRDLAVATITAVADAVLFFAPAPAFDPLGWEPGRATALGVDVAWAALAVPLLAVRRSRPEAALLGVCLLAVTGSLLLTCRPTLTVCVALAALVARGVGRTSLPALLAMALALAAWVVNEMRGGGPAASGWNGLLIAASYSLLLAAAAAFGGWQRRGRLREQSLRDQGELALGAERARIARDLHDVVSHSMTVMALQSAGARAVMGTDADRAAQALRTVEATGARAVEELRALLTGLHPYVGPGAAAPGEPDVRRLPELVAGARAAGREVVVTQDGEEGHASPDVGVAVYRLVQEGLTNALRYAGPGSIVLHVRWAPTTLAVVIGSPAPRPALHPATPSTSTGLGLRGLRERIELVGGTLSAGPDDTGRWLVTATFPLALVDPAGSA